MSGRRSRRVFDETFGDRVIEDFSLPFFCTSVDLSSFRLAVHREGSAAQWIRASASAPGLWPPVVDAAGHLHIDGGQLNNVPTDLMRESHDGPIIAVDVFAKQAVMTLGPEAKPPVGVRHLLGRRSKPRYPGIADTFNRCALLGSLQHQEGARHYADLYITPDLSDVGFRAFDRIQPAAEIGYRAALDCLATWQR
jgi:NTE family protein